MTCCGEPRLAACNRVSGLHMSGMGQIDKTRSEQKQVRSWGNSDQPRRGIVGALDLLGLVSNRFVSDAGHITQALPVPPP